ncbi:cytosine permease [Amycolatopsis sp. AA4]|uniref:cytosine permease n=1 Tax=Actinomycetes TaxID=1760 RepID=UPI0001B540A6|nr:cytosine permease [Streptomyces sp. AA4]ATY14441.1 cytosine permease [Amycolatopsis sp. AA4]EFL10529.1 permease [Streptomyces sp. AA4]
MTGRGDDYSLTTVPDTARRSWYEVAVQRFGQVSSLQQFIVGALLGYGMTFWNAVLAITIGSVLLEVITVLLGIAGVREGLSTSVLARWAGFGRKGSALVGLLVAVSLAGWFGVQNGVFAHGMHELTGAVPEWAWAVLGGVAITAISACGFRIMAAVSYLTVPAFLLLAGYSIVDTLSGHSLGALVSAQPPGPALSLGAATTLVSGAFILGALMTPDMTRFNRTTGDVVKQTVLSVTLGEYLIGLIGVLLAHATATSDIVSMVASSSGVLGTLVLTTAILKINDWNLYSASLGVVNVVDVLLRWKISRVQAVVLLGALGTAASAAGIADSFSGFLTAVGVLTPPVAGVLIAEYFVVRDCRAALDALRNGRPASGRDWVPAALVSWVLGTASAIFFEFGIPAINSVVVAFVSYLVAARIARAFRQGKGAAHMVALIGRDELKREMESGRVVVVDTMPVAYYEREHLPGALNIPGFPYEHAARFTDEHAPRVVPDKAAAIVVYCANTPCRNSDFVGNRLIELGYLNVRKYREGIADWVEAGYPTESGTVRPEVPVPAEQPDR